MAQLPQTGEVIEIDEYGRVHAGNAYDVDNVFTYHAPLPGQPERYTALRAKAKELAQLCLDSCPDSRERAVALTDLETSVFWMNASIARNEKGAA